MNDTEFEQQWVQEHGSRERWMLQCHKNSHEPRLPDTRGRQTRVRYGLKDYLYTSNFKDVNVEPRVYLNWERKERKKGK